jgi:hypothetical protein
MAGTDIRPLIDFHFVPLAILFVALAILSPAIQRLNSRISQARASFQSRMTVSEERLSPATAPGSSLGPYVRKRCVFAIFNFCYGHLAIHPMSDLRH